ncbi:MAG: hypothetical protein KAU48_00160 [Candidatus Thorarchaeota archaeon]|nr:hypothetical protein [Candidatus Thorarchaeota archaeon]
MFDKIKQVLILLQAAPPVDFTDGLFFGVVGIIGLIALIVVAIIYFWRMRKDKAANNHNLWNSAEG